MGIKAFEWRNEILLYRTPVYAVCIVQILRSSRLRRCCRGLCDLLDCR